MSLTNVIRAIISGLKEDTQVSQEPKIMETISKDETLPQDLPKAYDQMSGFTDMGGFGNINRWWSP